MTMKSKLPRPLKVRRPPIRKLTKLARELHAIGVSPASTPLTPEQQAVYADNSRTRYELSTAMFDVLEYLAIIEKKAALADYAASDWHGIAADETGCCHYCGAYRHSDECEHAPGCFVNVVDELNAKLAKGH